MQKPPDLGSTNKCFICKNRDIVGPHYPTATDDDQKFNTIFFKRQHSSTFLSMNIDQMQTNYNEACTINESLLVISLYNGQHLLKYINYAKLVLTHLSITWLARLVICIRSIFTVNIQCMYTNESTCNKKKSLFINDVVYH